MFYLINIPKKFYPVSRRFFFANATPAVVRHDQRAQQRHAGRQGQGDPDDGTEQTGRLLRDPFRRRGKEVMNFLKKWLDKHSMETDMQYGPCLNSKGVK
jgi:hypothetical protein